MGIRTLLFDDGADPDGLAGRQLAQSEFEIDFARDFDDAVRRVHSSPPDLVIIVASRNAAVERCIAIRSVCASPIVVLSPDICDEFIVACIEAGADSCLPSRLSRRELGARLNAILATPWQLTPRQRGREPCAADTLTIDEKAHAVTFAGRPISLTPTEFRLLAALARRSGSTVRHEELLSEVWATPPEHGRKTLRLYISYLRRKLQVAPTLAGPLVSQRGIGYRLTQGV